jgi:hypothetical protein
MLRIKKRGWFADVEVISGIIFRRNHRGIQKVSSIRRQDGFTDEYADGITEGFKMAAPYGDETGSPMKNANGITEEFKMAAPYGDVSYLPSK